MPLHDYFKARLLECRLALAHALANPEVPVHKLPEYSGTRAGMEAHLDVLRRMIAEYEDAVRQGDPAE